MVLVVKNLPANAGDLRDMGFIPGLGSSHGEGNVDPVQYSCLENSMDRGVWWATYSPWGHRELGTTEVIYLNVCWLRSAWSSVFTHTHTHTHQSHLYSFEICILQPEILDALVVVNLLSFIY